MYIMIFLSLFSFFQKNPESGIAQVKDFGTNPGNLAMFQYLPKDLGKNVPLVIVLHGCTQSADTIATESGWNKLADENKFMVVYPQQKLTNNIKKCFNWFHKGDIKKDSGETASIKQMIDFAIKNNPIDKKRVFITGLSAGGAMASVLLANYPDMFQAGALMAGIPFGATSNITEGLNAMKGNVSKTGTEWATYIFENNKDYHGTYPKMVVFQGVEDPYVHVNNADEIVKQYTSLHRLEKPAKIIENFDKNPDITLQKFENDLVWSYKIRGLGHAIAIDPGEGKKQGGKAAAYAIDKHFHAPYWAAKFFGIIK